MGDCSLAISNDLEWRLKILFETQWQISMTNAETRIKKKRKTIMFRASTPRLLISIELSLNQNILTLKSRILNSRIYWRSPLNFSYPILGINSPQKVSVDKWLRKESDIRRNKKCRLHESDERRKADSWSATKVYYVYLMKFQIRQPFSTIQM